MISADDKSIIRVSPGALNTNAKMDVNNSFLSTKRLFFSHWLASDYDRALKLWGNPNVTKYIANIKNTKGEVEKLLLNEIKYEESHNIQYWPVYLKLNNEFVGCCGLSIYKNTELTYELGCHICEEYWGEGYAQEASIAVIKYAFGHLKPKALFARHNPNNVSSKSILQKIGFKFIGTEYLESTKLNHPSYLLTAENFKQVNETPIYKQADIGLN